MEGEPDAASALKMCYAAYTKGTTALLCAALASFYRRVPVGHVEAGLRTGNLASPFPEEANRRLVSPLATLHFAPTETARQALLAERIPDERILVTGNTVIDALFAEHGGEPMASRCPRDLAT